MWAPPRRVGSRLYRWDALWAAVDTTLVPKVSGQMPGVQTWQDHSGDPARGASLVGHHWALIGLVSAWGVGYRCWPVLARLLPGQLNPLGVVGGSDGVQRLDFGGGVVALVRELQQWLGERPLRDLKPYGGLGDDPCDTLLAMHRLVHLALTACCLWRLTMLRDPQAPWLTAECSTPAGELSPLSFQRLHRALRRLVWQRMFAASAPGADPQKTAASDAQVFRIAV